jgi:hypothetical protein
MSAQSPPGVGTSVSLILDASVIVNFVDTNSWSMLLQLDGYSFATPKLVAQQVERKERRGRPIREAVASGALRLIDEPIPVPLLALFADVVDRLGQQDAAVLVYAITSSAGMAADDRALCNEARRRGVAFILGTEDLLATSVRQQRISIAQANRKLTRLRDLRFNSRHSCLCRLSGVECTCGRK